MDRRLLEDYAERASHRGHRPSRIGALRAPAIASKDGQGPAGPLAGEGSSGHEAQPGDPRRDEAQQVVQPRGALAEVLELPAAEPEHRVGGVDHAIDRRPYEPAGEEEAHRRHERVGQVLGDGLDGRRGDLTLVERGGRPAHEVVPDRPTRREQIAAGEVARDLARGDLLAARRAVGYHLVSRPTAALDESQVASAAIESVAENLTDSLVAPVCFFLAGGLVWAAVYRVINTADSMLGFRRGQLEYFGKSAARLDDLLSFIPARIAGLSLVAGAALAGERAGGALAVLRRDRRRTRSPNSGWPMAAMAGALGVVLEKPAVHRLGVGASPLATDIARAVRVVGVAAAVSVVLAVAAFVAGVTVLRA